MRVSVLSVPQFTELTTLISPPILPLDCVCTVTFVPLLSVFCSVAASAASTVMSVGSSSHLPAVPPGAAAVIMAAESILTFAPDVSITPPLPPDGADASSVPPT